MPLTGEAPRLSIFVGKDETRHHKPLRHEIVRRAREAGLAGASSVIPTARILSLTEGLPVLDAETRIRAFLSEVDELRTEATALPDKVEVVRHAGKPRS